MRRPWVLVTIGLLCVLLLGCRVHRKRKRKEPPPEPVAAQPAQREEPPPPAEPEPLIDPYPDYADRPHHWIYYPDEEVYFCDTHQHHWLHDGQRWVHTEEYTRPNYAAPILSNQSEFEIFRRHAEFRSQYPPGSRR